MSNFENFSKPPMKKKPVAEAIEQAISNRSFIVEQPKAETSLEKGPEQEPSEGDVPEFLKSKGFSIVKGLKRVPSEVDVPEFLKSKGFSIEKGPEQAPSEGDVLEFLRYISIGGQLTEVTREHDEKGLTFFEVKKVKEDGSSIIYSYKREGRRLPNGDAQPAIHSEIYEAGNGDYPVGGECVARYVDGELISEDEAIRRYNAKNTTN